MDTGRTSINDACRFGKDHGVTIGSRWINSPKCICWRSGCDRSKNCVKTIQSVKCKSAYAHVMLPVNFDLSIPPVDGQSLLLSRGQYNYWPHVSSPFASFSEVVGSNETPISLDSIRPWENALSVTVGNVVVLSGMRVSGEQIRKQPYFRKKAEKRTYC